MKIFNTSFRGLKLIKSPSFNDKRGFFRELLRNSFFSNQKFKFWSVSNSNKNVLRGLHIQTKYSQAKIITVTHGKIFDVVVDLRKSSESFGDWMGIILSHENNKQLWIPPGFAHGFLVLSEIAEFFYKVTDYWSKSDERCIKWDDEKIGIELPETPKNISKSDQKGTSFADAEYFL